MKKNIKLIGLLLLTLSLLVACGSKDKNDSDNKIIIGVSPSPHGDIIEVVKDDLKEKGIDLEIKPFTDYVTPNVALTTGDLDANFFQHLPYLEDFINQEKADLSSIGGVHIEPMAIFSDKVDSLDKVKEGDTVALPNDTVNGGRALLLLEANGLIKLDEEAGIEATVRDIKENPLNLEFKELEAATIPRVLGEVDIACINGNYALASDLNPLKDSIAIEDSESPYTNVIVVRTEDKDKEKFKILIEAIQSDKVKDYINETFDGAVIPVF